MKPRDNQKLFGLKRLLSKDAPDLVEFQLLLSDYSAVNPFSLMQQVYNLCKTKLGMKKLKQQKQKNQQNQNEQELIASKSAAAIEDEISSVIECELNATSSGYNSLFYSYAKISVLESNDAPTVLLLIKTHSEEYLLLWLQVFLHELPSTISTAQAHLFDSTLERAQVLISALLHQTRFISDKMKTWLQEWVLEMKNVNENNLQMAPPGSANSAAYGASVLKRDELAKRFEIIKNEFLSTQVAVDGAYISLAEEINQ